MALNRQGKDDERPSTGAGRAYERIRENIVGGKYPPKSRLRETQLAAELEMSRTPVREALRRLTSEGVISYSPQSGAFVPSWDEEHVAQLYDLRAVLESNCAELAATRMTPVDIDALRSFATQMENALASGEADSLEKMSLLNRAFHERIMACSGNDRLRELTLNAVAQLPNLHRSFRRYEPAQTERSMRHHRDLIDAFRVADAHWASSMMRAHILAGKYQIRLAAKLDAPGPLAETDIHALADAASAAPAAQGKSA